MSRTREGRERDSNETGRGRGETQPVTESQPSASRPSSYTPGRESMRDFPRKSTSLRDRNIGRGYDRGWQERSPSDFEDRSGDYSGYYRERFGYGAQGRDPESSYEPRGRMRSREEDRGRYGRGGFSPERSYEEYDYDRGRRSTSREDYDEPYNRETLGGRYGQERGSSRTRQAPDYYQGESDYRTEGRRERRDAYYGQNYLRCRDIMTKDVTSCSPQSSIREVAEKMKDDDVGSIPVLENGRLIGIVTDRDIVCRVLTEGLDTRATTVGQAMSEEVVTCMPEETVLDAIRKMGEHQIRRIPVCDINGRLRGIIAMADVALEAERDRELADALEDISQPLPNRSRRM